MITTIGDIAEFQKGFAFKSKDYQDEGTRIVRVTNLNKSDYSDNNSLFISVEKAEEYKQYSLIENDVVISTVGSWITNPASIVGKVAIIPSEADGSLLNQNAVRLRAKNSCMQEYLGYILRDDSFSNYIVGTAQGSANQASITLDDIRRFVIDLPDIIEQKRRITVLRSIDAKIRVNNQINRNSFEQAKLIFNNSFNQLSPNGLLSDVVRENEKSKIKVRQARGVDGKYPFYTSGSNILEYNEYLVDGRNIYLNTGGTADVKFYVGKAAYSTDTWSIFGNEYTDYLYILLSNNVQEINDVYFEGSALKHLQKKNLLNKEIYIPNSIEIGEFNELVCPLFDKTILNINENKRLSYLRDTLLPRLMSGELDVSELDI